MPKHDEILSAARERMSLCVDSESTNRTNALDDLNFLAGEHWPAEAKRQRDSEGRPCITVNKLPAFLRQVTNDQRQNTPGIKVHPVDGGADVETAEVLQGMIRHIEYDSNADVAYDTAVNSAAACGIGYFRILTDYESPDSFNQIIRFRRERNALNVYIDPYSREPDGSDMRFAFITDTMSKEEFKRQYPDAKATDGLTLAGIGDSATHWMPEGQVLVAEYYWVDEKRATLVQLSNGATAYKQDAGEDELTLAGLQIVAERETTRKTIRWAKITGCDVLAESEVPCDWIPVFPVYGEELDVGGKVVRKGMVRDAKDPSQMYNYWITSATEEVALRPKIPFIGAEGQFEVDKTKWATANARSYPYIQYKPVTVNGQIAPAPQRQAMADIPMGALAMLSHAADDIKATTGIHDASLGARGNETSGRAILARQREGDLSNFHFTDNLNRSVRHAGRCIINMIPRIYDTPRVVRIRGEDESMSSAPVNQPELDPETGIERILNDLSIGKYDVTVTAGPSYTTQRQEAAEGMSQLAQAYPPLMQAAGDLVVGSMDWPGADDIAERLKRTIPPQIVGQEDEGQEIPPQIQVQMMEMRQALEQAQQQLQEAESGLTKAKIDADSRVAVAQINAQSRQDVEELKGMVQMLLQSMTPPPQLTAAAYRNGPESPPPQTAPAQPIQPSSPPQAGFLMPEAQVSAPLGAPFATSGAPIPDDDPMRIEQ